ncbi:MAG: sulfotransferase domain-containing protein, partial [Planctomycetota bacterium]
HHAPMTPEQAVDKLTRAPHMVIKTHARPDSEGRLPEFAENEPLVQAIIDHAHKINVVRDGRNVISSQHLYEQGFDPAAHLPTSEFLRTSFFGEPRPAYWARHALSWKHVPGMLTVRFEDIIKNTSETLGRIAETIGIQPRRVEPLLPMEQPTSKLARALNRALARGETTAIDGRPAPGIKPEKWFNVWTPEDRAYFDEHGGDALIELGYEPDHSWAIP